MRSELSYKLADYQKAGIEAPERIMANPEHTEGDMMTDDEVFDYSKDSLGVLRVMDEHNPSRAAELRAVFLTDCNYLLKIGRITQDEYEMLVVESGAGEL
jgi:hypothetical protein